MTHFDDLSPYRYLATGEPAVNIGWLDASDPFPTGQSEVAFVERLAWICAHQRMNQTRGVHQCNLCEPIPGSVHYLHRQSGDVLLGNAEIRIAGPQLYAAPDLILHYVVDHQYKPPEPFMTGVAAIRHRLPRPEWSVLPRLLPR